MTSESDDDDNATARRWRRPAIATGAVMGLLAAGLAIRAATNDSSSDAPPITVVDPEATYGVGQRDVTFVDSSRPTDALPDRDVEAKPDRTLPTVILYPTDGSVPSPRQTDAAAAQGRFSLIVFSHGSSGNPDAYVPLIEPLVRAGYVVALPTFPLTSVPGSPVDDARNQPADVSFVITELLNLSADAGGWLGGRIDADHIAAAGHSLGAVTTIGVTYDSCCADSRIDAAVALSGVAVGSGDNSLDDQPPTPLLLVHGAQDDVVPISGSDNLFEDATGPVYYLRLDDADHVSLGVLSDGALTAQATRAFLDAELKDRPAALDALADVVAASGRAEWRTRNTG